MAAERPIAEDELHAFVDDRLETTRRREVERYLESQPELSRRVFAYRAQRDSLRMALASPAAEPIPPELNLSRLLDERLRRRTPWWRLAATVVLCLGLGGAAGWYVGSAPRLSRTELAMSLLQQQAMASYAVYAPDRRHPVEVAAAEPDHLSTWLSNRLHRTVAPPDLGTFGYHLLGGRLLATERGNAAALFVYDNAQGDRLSVLMRPMSPELRSTRADIGDGGVNGCTWIDNGMGYAVVATLPDTTLDRVADQISREGG